jgi:hypothetical protein
MFAPSFSSFIKIELLIIKFLTRFLKMLHNVFVYELLRVSATNLANKN